MTPTSPSCPPRHLLGLLLLASAGCSDPLTLGTDILWSADHESGDLQQWMSHPGGGVRLPSADSTIAITSDIARRSAHAVELVNPAQWSNLDEGPELFHVGGALADAYYSAWFYLAEDYLIEPSLTLMRLRSRIPGREELASGEELQLRSVATGGYVLQVFSHNTAFLLEPLADPAPHVEAMRWFHLEARYQPRAQGTLRVWLDGALVYDLDGRPAAAGAEVVLVICNVAEASEPRPLRVFSDDAVISLSRATPRAQLSP